ncbi:MAG: hypothetical protein V4724_39190 [Pseudomonadota bacterium]
MDTSTIPSTLHERVVCSISAAAKYNIPTNLLLAVAQKEAGRPGQWVRNRNGTSDVGTMQFNTAYLATLDRYHITAADVASAGCYPYDLAAWRLRQHILHDVGDLWTRASNYHSRTPRYNAPYRLDLMAKANWWADWLHHQFITTAQAPRPPPRPASLVSASGDDNRHSDSSVVLARGTMQSSNRYVPRIITATVQP